MITLLEEAFTLAITCMNVSFLTVLINGAIEYFCRGMRLTGVVQ